jgi:hypothetical protein
VARARRHVASKFAQFQASPPPRVLCAVQATEAKVDSADGKAELDHHSLLMRLVAKQLNVSD